MNTLRNRPIPEPTALGSSALFVAAVVIGAVTACGAEDRVALKSSKSSRSTVQPTTRSVSVEGIEVVQSIQDIAHSVPILADRPTLARVYLSVQTVTGFGVLEGEITVTPTRGGTAVVVPSLLPVSAWETWNGNWKTFKRQHLHASLNFELPAEAVKEGNYRIELTKVKDRVNNREVPCSNCAAMGRRYSVVPTAPMRLRVLGLKYPQDGSNHAPSQVDYDSIQSWLTRAYPIAELKYSHRNILWTGSVPFGLSDANPEVKRIRVLDVGGGVDARTHYYGLVHDGGFYFGGGSERPNSPDPSAVGSGPAGEPLPTRHFWDDDDSYADAYAGHELGHTLGQRHVGGICGEQPSINPDFPFPRGQLSAADSESAFVGLDFGDPALGIARRALDGAVWRDTMSYCPYRWVSSYTYCRIRNQLIAEDALGSTQQPLTPAKGDRGTTKSAMFVSGQPSIVVLGLVDLDKRTGKITSLDMVSSATVGQPSSRIKCRAHRKDGTEFEVPAAEYDQSEGPWTFSCVIPVDGVIQVDLELDHAVLDSRRASANPPQFSGRIRGDYSDGKLAYARWTATDADGDALKYSVQILGGDIPCETVLVGATEPMIAIADLELPPNRESVTLRVLATDGFHTTDVTDTIAVNSPRLKP